MSQDNSFARPTGVPLSNAFTPTVEIWYDRAHAYHWDIFPIAIPFLVLTAALVGLAFLLGWVGLLLLLLLWPPLHLGMVAVALNMVQEKRASFRDLFRGFGRPRGAYGTHLVAGLVLGPLVGLPLSLLWQAWTCNDHELMPTAVALLLFGVGPAIYLMIRCFFFALPLVVERGLGPLAAVRGSWIMTRGHVGQLLIPVLGLIVPGLFLFFSIPYIFLALAAAYAETVWQLRIPAGPPPDHPGPHVALLPAPRSENSEQAAGQPPSAGER